MTIAETIIPFDFQYFFIMRIALFLSVALVLVSAGHLSSIPLSEQDGNGRVIGGEVAKDGEFPWQVSIRDIGTLGATHFCGGSIIDKEWILTTAYCCLNAVKYQLFTTNKFNVSSNEILNPIPSTSSDAEQKP